MTTSTFCDNIVSDGQRNKIAAKSTSHIIAVINKLVISPQKLYWQ
jgi:hypothetical protein